MQEQLTEIKVDLGKVEQKVDDMKHDVVLIKDALLCNPGGLIRKVASVCTQLRIQWVLLGVIGVALSKFMGLW